MGPGGPGQPFMALRAGPGRARAHKKLIFMMRLNNFGSENCFYTKSYNTIKKNLLLFERISPSIGAFVLQKPEGVFCFFSRVSPSIGACCFQTWKPLCIKMNALLLKGFALIWSFWCFEQKGCFSGGFRYLLELWVLMHMTKWWLVVQVRTLWFQIWLFEVISVWLCMVLLGEIKNTHQTI